MERVCIVTGATSGIGRSTAEQLAMLGCEVVLLARSVEKLSQAEAEIRASCGHDRVWSIQADLSRLAEVRAAAAVFLATGKPLHVLLNNAAVVNSARRETEDGFEETWAVNHLAHVLLTSLLLPCLRESAPSRVVVVSSEAYAGMKALNWDDIGFASGYQSFRAYAQSKLANLLFSAELSERLSGSGVTVNALHPGMVRTGLGQQDASWWMRAMFSVIRLFMSAPESGAETSVYLATSPEVAETTGGYFIRCRPARLRAQATDREASQRLWALSAEQLGLDA
jgi:NAD(P)-dependent dehydrogenase (short-subunit alcohol dehydrogenase family)